MRLLSISLISLLCGCATLPPDPLPSSVPPVSAPSHTLVTVDRDSGERVWVLRAGEGDCRITEFARDGVALREGGTPCGDRLVQLGDRLLIVDDDGRSSTVLELAGFRIADSMLVDQNGNARLEWAPDGMRLIDSAGSHPIPLLRDSRLLSSGDAIGVQSGADGETIVRVGRDGQTIDLLAGADLARVDSWDLEPREGQLVFSAVRRDGAMDVGLASTEGGAMRWLPSEPGNEYAVTWAPRGNKVTWMIDSPAGVVMRSVHIPTAYQLAVPLGFISVESVAWEPEAERVFVAHSSPLESTSILSVRYGGEERATFLPPASRISRESDSLPGLEGALLLMPAGVRYGHSYPVVIVEGDGSRWSPELARVALDPSVGVVWLPAGGEEARARVREALRDVGWVDPSRISLYHRE